MKIVMTYEVGAETINECIEHESCKTALDAFNAVDKSKLKFSFLGDDYASAWFDEPPVFLELGIWHQLNLEMRRTK